MAIDAAPVPRNPIRVVTFFAVDSDAVAALQRDTPLSLEAAIVARFDFALRVAAVPGDTVTVVAVLRGTLFTITALLAGLTWNGAEVTCLQLARGATTIVADRCAIVACLTNLDERVAADHAGYTFDDARVPVLHRAAVGGATIRAHGVGLL